MLKQPPPKSKGIFSDIRLFFLNKPEIKTKIRFHSEEERMFYSKNILQRVGIGVDMFSVLNIHQIGIETPVNFVFGELLKWNGDSSCWPNHIAKVTLKDNKLDKIKVNLFGWPRDPFKPKKGLASLQLFHLFNMNAIKIQHTPDPYDFDNARFLLYKCTGGYPIGYFLMYTRSSIAERGEKEMAQLFMMVGFNFYGNKNLTKWNIINKTWEAIHNRATTHIMNKFKQLSEYRFEQFTSQ